jgi:putative DNA methylase
MSSSSGAPDRGPAVAAERVGQRLIEAAFPYLEISRLARADSIPDPVYGGHKWWARRPRAIVRALILAAHLPASAPNFHELMASDAAHLAGKHVGDPFAGGGTTLVEAARLGASVTGVDVDPLAVRIIREELAHEHDEAEFRLLADEMLDDLHGYAGDLFPAADSDHVPLHYFRLRRVACPSCDERSMLCRNLVLARSVGKAGAVVRDSAQDVFCPACLALHSVSKQAKTFSCCDTRWKLAEGTFDRARFHCPICRAKASLCDLQAGSAEEVLVAVEDTSATGRRRLRQPNADDVRAIENAAHLRAATPRIPQDRLDLIDGGRPRSYGFQTVADLFGDRQAIVLARAFAWLAEREDLPDDTRARLEVAVSNAISANNRLCGYATDYGRLAPALAGVRSYSLPILAVELNPLHPSAGRGTLAATLRRTRRSCGSTIDRVMAVDEHGERLIERVQARRAVPSNVNCRTAERPFPGELGKCTAVITDPPYYDYIAYSELSLLYRTWLTQADPQVLAGQPIYPSGVNPRETFTAGLARALKRTSTALAPGAVLAFTYHAASAEPWDALSDAVCRSGLVVTATFPVWGDARSHAAHGHPGSCEWDLVWVCRPKTAAPSYDPLPPDTSRWLAHLADEGLSGADVLNLRDGLSAARRTWSST